MPGLKSCGPGIGLLDGGPRDCDRIPLFDGPDCIGSGGMDPGGIGRGGGGPRRACPLGIGPGGMPPIGP